MKKLFIFLLIFNFKIVSSSEIKLEKFADDLDKPWSLSFINKDSIIFTEKSGKLFTRSNPFSIEWVLARHSIKVHGL